jgi:hypothetical protein
MGDNYCKHMVSVKERTVKGRTYVYVSATASYKGDRKRFEKSVGPKDMDPEILKRRIEFYTWLGDQNLCISIDIY